MNPLVTQLVRVGLISAVLATALFFIRALVPMSPALGWWAYYADEAATFFAATCMFVALVLGSGIFNQRRPPMA